MTDRFKFKLWLENCGSKRMRRAMRRNFRTNPVLVLGVVQRTSERMERWGKV